MSLKVLLADDSMTAQNMGKKILAESGYDVTVVSNGAAAVKKIAEVKPDVVILDIYMPGYTGLEVCERVRANLDTANLPVLLTVGKMEPYRAEDGAKVRADGVIVKPFEATDLLAVVKKMAEKAVSSARRVVVQEEEPPEEEIGQPEPAMPASVDVPSEMAQTPALSMEEFDASPAQVSGFNPAMEWTAAPEQVAPEQISDIPWSFNQAVATEPQVQSAPVEEVAPMTEIAPSSDVEFTSAPQAGEVEVQQAEGLEAGYGAASASEVEISTDPALTSAQEMTEFVTAFGEQNPSSSEENVIAELPTIEGATESAWDGWAHVEPAPATAFDAPQEPAPTVDATSEAVDEPVPETTPVIDDFEAKVAAAMAGFGVEPGVGHPVEAVPGQQPEPIIDHQDVAGAETLASPNVDDFEARVAAAMSGFATMPVESPEPTSEAHAHPAEVEAVADEFESRVAAAMSGFTTEGAAGEPTVEVEPNLPPVKETKLEPVPAPVPAEDDFDARLAQALSAFETAPEMTGHKDSAVVSLVEPLQETHVEAPAVVLNETTVLPQEAMLSLEEEMKQALAQRAGFAPEEVVVPAEPGPVAELVAPVAPEVAHVEIPVAAEPELMGEFDPSHVAQQPEPPQLPEVAAAAFAAAASAGHAEPAPASSEKFADAVHRAIERLKPQLIAEIVKELKGE